ncbi:hypothetical protein BGZ49_010300 [Haplosporangium sp. Z 27]|nr:hypothetical protein BGZ49_010300 [Haplosporangium sp. Z 27]
MRIKTILLAATCLVLPLVNAVDISEITQLKGPLTSTPAPAVGNGAVTNPSSTTFGTGTTSRTALFVPGNVYKDYPGWLALYKALVFQGIPVKVTKDASVARGHSTVIAYQAFQSKYLGFLDGMLWANYANSGKTLISIGFNSNDLFLTSTFGVTADTKTNVNGREAIQLNAPSDSNPLSNVNSQFDLTDVRDAQIPLWQRELGTGFPTIGYTIKSGAFALGTYITGDGAKDTKHAITIKSNLFGGRSIAIGIDLGAYVGISNGAKTNGIPRSYDAQYEPGYDNFFRIIKSLYSQSTSTGLVTSWPVPGNKGVHFSWTYDIDAQDSYELALVAAKDLQSRGIKGTINWQAKLVKDAYDVASFSHYYRNISLVEALGNMELSSHSVSHSPNLMKFPIGTGKEIWNGTSYDESNYFPFIGQCTSTAGSWTTNIPNATTCDTPNKSQYFYTLGGSLLGEARVSKYILEAISVANATVRSFRTGHLLYPDPLPQVLEAAGYKYSSSSANNDQNTNMPFQLFYNMAYNQAVNIIEFPVSGSDEDGKINGDWFTPGTGNYPNGSYAYQQYQVIQKIAKYGGQYTFLIHPTDHAVPGVEPTLFSDKLAFQQTMIPKISDIAYFDSMGGRGDFHSARIASGIDVSVSGSVATVTVTLPKSIVDLTLRVPIAWGLISSTVGVKATPGAVILLNTIPVGTVTLKFKTFGNAGTPSAPAPGTPTTTSSIKIASPTIPAPIPTLTSPFIVDDFSDPSRYSTEQNALGFYTGDDNTVTQRSTVQADWLLLSFTNASYWYTLLGPASTCNDYSRFTKLSLALRYPTASRIGFSVDVQGNDNTTCTTLVRHPQDITPLINAATAGNDGWLHIDLPLSNITNIDLKSLRSISLAGFASTGEVEIDYIYFS